MPSAAIALSHEVGVAVPTIRGFVVLPSAQQCDERNDPEFRFRVTTPTATFLVRLRARDDEAALARVHKECSTLPGGATITPLGGPTCG